MSDHTPGAIKAAEAITGGTYGDTTRYKTSYGMKTVMGVADIIDRETAAPELLGALKLCLKRFDDLYTGYPKSTASIASEAAMSAARDAIAKAEQ